MVLESSAQEVASMFKGKRRLWRNKASGATAMVAEEVLIRQGEFHVWMWLEKTSAGSDVLHTWSGVKNNNIRRLHWNDTRWRCEGALSIPETHPGAKIKKMLLGISLLVFRVVGGLLWRFCTDRKQSWSFHYGSPRTCRRWVSIREIKVMDCWYLQREANVIHYPWKLLLPLIWVSVCFYQCFQWKHLEHPSVFFIKYL